MSPTRPVVEVPERAVDEVIAAMGRTTIKGTRPTVRRYREETSAEEPLLGLTPPDAGPVNALVNRGASLPQS